MARLTIEQVKAPDFSSVSEMLARANQSFNSGMESAKGILDSYNEGQQAKGDQALIGQLAGLSSEEDLANFLRTTDLSSMNISDTMRQNILGARATILGNNATRQSTANAADANSRANAAEGRTAAEYLDGVARRDEQRALTPSFVGALQEAQRYGFGATPNEREMLAATLQAEAGGEGVQGMLAAGAVIRNRAELGNYGGNTISGVIMQPGQFSAWNGVTGYAGGEGAIDMGNIRVSEDAYRVADAILSGNYQDPTGGATHYYNPAVATPAWGQGQNPSGGQWTTIGNHVFGNPDGVRALASGAVPGYIPGQITSNPAAGPGMTDFTTALAASTHMTPDEAMALFNNVLGQQKAGQDRIDTAEARRQAELAAQATTAALLDPNNLTEAAVQRDLLSTPGLSYGNQLAAAGQNLGQFAGVIAPSISPDTQVNDALARSRSTDAQTAANDPTLRPFQQAAAYDAADNVGQAVLSEFQVPEGSGLDADYVTRRLTQMADDAGVSVGEIATVMSQTAQGNFGQFNDMLQAAPDTDMYATIMSLAERNFGEQARAAYNDSLAQTSAREAERAAAELQLSTARTRAAKLPVGSSERAAAEAEINNLRDTILKGMTPQEREQNLRDYISKTGMASRLQGLDPNSAEFYRAMAQLEETIRTDSTLTPNEKELLLRDVRG